QGFGGPQEAFDDVEGVDELVVEAGEMADDLAAGLDGVALGTGILVELKERLPAGAGEEGGGQQGGVEVVVQRIRTVARVIDAVIGRRDLRHPPGTGLRRLGRSARSGWLVAVAQTVQEGAEENVGQTPGATIIVA